MQFIFKKCSTSVAVKTLKQKWPENFPSTTDSIPVKAEASIPEAITVKKSDPDLEVSSWIIPGSSFCGPLPVRFHFVWVCLCMRHSLLNSEERRYFEWTPKGMSQTSTFSSRCYVSTKGEETFGRRAGSNTHVGNKGRVDQTKSASVGPITSKVVTIPPE